MPSKSTQKAFVNVKTENVGAVGSDISYTDGSAPSDWPQGLQIVISVIERIEDRVQNEGITAGPVAELMRALKMNVLFAQGEVLRVHGPEIGEHRDTKCGIEWNTDFAGHWETLLEITERVESAARRYWTKKKLWGRIGVEIDPKVMNDCREDLRKWKGELRSETGRVVARKTSMELGVHKLNNGHTGIDQCTETPSIHALNGHNFTTSFKSSTLSQPAITSVGRNQINYNVKQQINNIYLRTKSARKSRTRARRLPLMVEAEDWSTEAEE
ncbi:hypothetical protein VKT23_000360 [Stygiomarasmius scandens]|uniref:Uncharacterized protein n=1 Tax=Marasmiellus scandens TaxID=2682957 RepID=A0ABR1K437_9AGAR